jgi:predicted esterase
MRYSAEVFVRSMISALTIVVLSVFALASCKQSHAQESAPSASKTVTLVAAPAPISRTEPLIEFRDLDILPIPDYGPAVAYAPVGATSRRPIVLGVHGNSETPEDFCKMVHEIVKTRAFVLCPRGVRPPDRNYTGYTFMSPQHLAIEVDAAIKELDRHYPGYVDADSVLYIGFSRGAFLSVGIIATEPQRYTRAILIEGGQDAWTGHRIDMYGAEGGARVLFACGQEECMIEAQRVADKLELAGVETRVTYRAGAGHVYTGQVAEDLRNGFEWVITGDPRWDP